MDLYNSYLRLFIYFPLVLFLLYFFLRILKQLSPPLSHESRIYVVEKIMISPRVLLLVVRVGDEYLLLSAGASGVSLLKELGCNWEEKLPGQNYKKTINSFPGVEGVFSLIRKVFYGKRSKKMKNFEEEFDDLTRNLYIDRDMDGLEKKYFRGKDREK